MKICFVINDIATENCGTSLALMHKAHTRGHTVYVMSVEGFSYHYDTSLRVYGIEVKPLAKISTPKKFLSFLQTHMNKRKVVTATTLDVFFIRNNPTEEASERKWAEQAGVAFGRMVQQEGILVLNDAYALSHAFIDKLYFEELPQCIKPASIITRRKEEILDFWESQQKQMVLKPLEGSGGQNVYLIDFHEKNINQIIETIIEQGYVIAQEYLPAVKNGDVRVLLMNGRPIYRNGKQAMIRRKTDKGEFRSNFRQGASAEAVKELTPGMKKIIELTAPKLIQDGLFFVGLDIVKDKLIEINVLSPGGLEHFKEIGYPDFTDEIIASIEKKVTYKELYGTQLSNRALATME